MRRSRRWCGVGAVAVAVVGAAALAWPTVPAAGSGAVPGGGSGTLVVSPSGTLTASVGTILTFTFAAPATSTPPPPAHFVSPAIIITVSMPQGWTVSCPDPDCAVGPTSTEFRVVESAGTSSFTFEVQATPPGYAGPATFTATGVTHSKPAATLSPVTSSPLNVICPTDGLGTMAVDPTAVGVASSGTFTFTYTAGSCGASPSGSVGVTVPTGWTSSGPIATPVNNLTPGALVTFTYGPAQAGSTGPATFVAWQAAAGGPTQDLTSTPVVMVTPTAPPSTSASSTSASSTSAPPSTSTPASTSAPASRTGTATVTSSPSGTTRAPGQPGALVAVALVGAGLILLAGTAGLLTARSRRRRGRLRRVEHGTAGGDVRAVPHAGPPPTVGVRDTGNRPALTVRIEPRASGTATSVKEERP